MPRSLVSISDLSRSDIEGLLRLADELTSAMSRPDRPAGVRGRLAEADGAILATLFLEPSTRTRLSFESAMLRLGGQVISSASAAASSATKGETVADTVRVIQGYADVIAIRHPCAGAALVAAEQAGVPVINAGDGSHEHPTQTLCDLFTIWKEHGRLTDLDVLVCGDLKHGRTVHSLMAALGHFDARVILCPAPGLDLPAHVLEQLASDHGARIRRAEGLELPIDVAGVCDMRGDASEPGPIRIDRVDAFYMTRAQRERLDAGDDAGGYQAVDASLLADDVFRDTVLMHPLPRVGELAYRLDADRRAAYFRQAAYGVPVRMALLAALLELRPGVIASEAPSAEPTTEGTCGNPRCITNDANERRHLRARFRVAAAGAQCVYCDRIEV